MRSAVFLLVLAAVTAPAAELRTSDGAVLRYQTFGRGDPVIRLSHR